LKKPLINYLKMVKMMKMDSVIKINGSTLHAIPAIHYRAVFAREVNYLCYCEKTCPDAIAVELGPHMVREITAWMEELGAGSSKDFKLPCMLGILVKNRLLHPDFREASLYLQEHYGKPLNEISPVLYKRLLHFSDKYLIGLSSTDSIVEAIRCAVELNIPVYGVDLDEYSTKPDEFRLIEEPSASSFDLWKYVSQNEKTATLTRDPYVDGRREQVMAARLKAIMLKHKHVLFTGGLAHWEMIKGLLNNPAVRPADIFIPAANLKFTRAVVHPKIAVMFMDIYPVLTTLYEENRHNPLVKNRYSFSWPDAGKLYLDILNETYKEYFMGSDINFEEESARPESNRIPDFERLLASIRMVHQHSAPSMSDLLGCAHSMMPFDFYNLLTCQLMDIGRPWANLKQFPELPLISYVSGELESGNITMDDNLFQLIGVRMNNPDQEVIFDNKSSSFSIKYHQLNQLSEHLTRLWQWEDEPKETLWSGGANVWIWPPCEALLFGSAYEAARITATRSNEPVSAVFEGSLYDGFDVKASIRSIIKGERKIYIKKPLASKKSFSPDVKKPEPTVFIFENDQIDIASTWTLLMGGTNLGNHIRNKKRYNEIVKQYGSCFISSISWTHYEAVPQHLNNDVESISILDGITAFGSPCMNAKQGAQWVEDNDYHACPVINYTSITRLIEYYRKHNKMEVSISDWTSALIMFAIPYAKMRVVVIAPDNFRVPAILYSEAARRNISIDLLPLKYFSGDRISEMRRRITVRALDSDGFHFSPDIETVLGQKSDKYFELLPSYMLQQIGKT
jgi:hypothetical protein